MHASNAQLHEVTRESLSEEFPAWRVWQSGGGLWWATRSRSLSDHEVNVGLYKTVGSVDTLEGIRNLLFKQVAIETKLAAR